MNTQSLSRQKRSFGPLRDKTLRSMIRRKFITEYGFSDAVPVAEFITDDLMALLDRICPSLERVKPGQMVWMGVPKDLPRNQIGQRLRDLPLKPILLTVLTRQDIDDHIAARSQDEYLTLRRQRVARMFQEADAQGTTLPYTDPAAVFGLSESTVERDVQHWQEKQGEVLPHRGRVHDMGPTTSHKEPIIERILQGHQIPDVARALDHSIADVECYYADYNAVEVACGITDNLTKIVTMTRLKLSVVKQYYRLVEKFQPHKMLKNRLSSAESSALNAPWVE